MFFPAFPNSVQYFKHLKKKEKKIAKSHEAYTVSYRTISDQKYFLFIIKPLLISFNPYSVPFAYVYLFHESGIISNFSQIMVSNIGRRMFLVNLKSMEI